MRKLFQVFALLFVASIIFTGCRSEDPEVPYIVVEDNDTLDQTVYADDETGESGVRITTLAPWWSAVRDVTANATAETARNAPNWVSVSPESGGAGTYTLIISLEPNTTGANRSAEISIISAETVIRINITQQGVTECGYIPQPDDPSIIRAENVIGDDFSEVITVRARLWEAEDRIFIVAEAPFQNNGFVLYLANDVPEPFVWLSITYFIVGNPDNFAISDRNTKTAVIPVEGAIIAFDSNDDSIGYFQLVERINENKGYWVAWIYVDRDVTVKGTYRGKGEWDWEENIDLDLRKGWNTVYVDDYWNRETRIGRTVLTSQKPADINLRWYFNSWSSHSTNARGVENRRSIFRR